MIRRVFSLLMLIWIMGFIWFAVALPQPVEGEKTDAVVVLTGGSGRIARGLEVLEKGWAPKMLVSGVDKEVRPAEFQAEYKVPDKLMACCVTLGFESVDTQSNAKETTRWLMQNKIRSVRLVTTDWHMARAAYELRRIIPASTRLVSDAVPSHPSLRILFLEYHKLLARWVSGLWEG